MTRVPCLDAIKVLGTFFVGYYQDYEGKRDGHFVSLIETWRELHILLPPPNSAFERRRQRTVNQRIELFRNEFEDQQQGGPGQDQQQGGPGQDQQQGGPGQDQQQGGPGQGQQQGGPGHDQQQGEPGQDQQQGGPGQDQQQGGPGQEYNKLQPPHENEFLI